MLTRPGFAPGPEWMGEPAGSPAGFRQIRKAILRIRVLFGGLQVASVVVRDIARDRVHGRHGRSDNSLVQIAGMTPLFVGRAAHSVIAYGGVATGIVAIFGVTAGVIAFEAISVGAFSFGALSLAIFVLAALAAGWLRGRPGICPRDPRRCFDWPYAYGFAMALGYHEASGKQKESLFG